jgi:hypothetical protein
MPTFTKHVGRTDDRKKVVVVFRQLPEEVDQCLVVYTQALEPQYHDELMRFVDGHAQAETDFYKAASREMLYDGLNVLESLHTKKFLVKVPTASITMTPIPGMEIKLDELNAQLNQMAASKTTSGDISGDVQVPANVAQNARSPGALDDKAIADGMRRQAAMFENEAKKLREQADDLDPNRQGRPRKKSAATEAA